MKPKKRVWEFKFCQMMSSSSHSPSNPSSGTGIYQIVWTLNAEVDPRFWGLWSHQNRRGAWSDAHHRDGEIIGARPRFVSAWPMARPSSGSIWKMALPCSWERAISEHVANLLEQEFNNSVNGPRRGKRRASWGGFSRWDPQNYILNVVNVWAWDSSRSGAPWTNRALKLSWFSWAHLMTSVPICVLSCKSQGRVKLCVLLQSQISTLHGPVSSLCQLHVTGILIGTRVRCFSDLQFFCWRIQPLCQLPVQITTLEG